MNVYSIAVRCLIVSLAGAVVIEGTPVGQRLKQRVLSESASLDLLHGVGSPFQTLTGHESTVGGVTATSALNPPAADNTQAIEQVDSRPTTEEFKHTIKKGATLASLWREIKGAPHALKSFVTAFSHKHPKLRAGEVFSVTRKGDEVVELRRDLGAGATLVIEGASDAGYAPRIEQVATRKVERKISGVIYSSLVDAARGVDIPYSIVDDFVDLFGARVEFRKDLQPGDSFTVLYDEVRAEDGRVISRGDIKAASLSLSGDLYAVVRDVGPDGTVRYFDEKGSMPTSAFLRYPVQFTRIGSMFSTARFHPVLHINRPHNGVDFSAPIGTPVRTIGDGVVTFSGYNRSGGYMVKIAHDSRYTTEYMHLSKIAPGAHKGARVSRGSVIGAVGNTGLSSGPHLHFGLFDNGKYVDPMKAKVIQSAPVIKAPKAVFAMIAEMRKEHRKVAVASAATGAGKKKA
jgi:murein DD-endopeptidase MepM/ murein hydrolase activator NlpD